MAAAIWFRKQYIDPILRGEKTQTLRRETKLRAGDVVTAMNGPRPPFARLRVLRVDPVSVRDLTEGDARRDGFDSLAELRSAIAETYGAEALRVTLQRIRFRVDARLT